MVHLYPSSPIADRASRRLGLAVVMLLQLLQLLPCCRCFRRSEACNATETLKVGRRASYGLAGQSRNLGLSCELRVAGCKLQVASCKLRASSFEADCSPPLLQISDVRWVCAGGQQDREFNFRPLEPPAPIGGQSKWTHHDGQLTLAAGACNTCSQFYDIRIQFYDLAALFAFVWPPDRTEPN